MKKLLTVLAALALTACGYSSRENEVVGQVKKVMFNTPLVCSDYYDVDLSLGVMRNGTGSMSTQDMWIVVNKSDLDVLKQANADGGVVKIIYDTQRVSFCTNGMIATKVEVVK